MRQLLEVEESLGNQSAIDPKKGDVVWYHVTEYIYIRDCICMSLLYYIKNHYNTLVSESTFLHAFLDESYRETSDVGTPLTLPPMMTGG